MKIINVKTYDLISDLPGKTHPEIMKIKQEKLPAGTIEIK
jgi:hypothetical protein